MLNKTIFFSYSFSDDSKEYVDAFRTILKLAIAQIQKETFDTGAVIDIELIDGEDVDPVNPKDYIFPNIKSCDLLIALLTNEKIPIKINLSIDQLIKTPFVSASCLQEITLAYAYGKNILVWTMDGSQKIGFINNMTTYKTFRTQLSVYDKDKIVANIKKSILKIFQPSYNKNVKYIYNNQFDLERGNRVFSYLCKNYATKISSVGGQYEIPNCNEYRNRGLMIADTKDNWNWHSNTGYSIAMLEKYKKIDLLPNGKEVLFEIRCKSTGTVNIRPVLEGVITKRNCNPSIYHTLAEFEDKQINKEDEWKTIVFKKTIEYKNKNNPPYDEIRLHLATNTGENLLFVEKVLFGIKT